MHRINNKTIWVLTAALVCSVIATACKPQNRTADAAHTSASAAPHADSSAFICDDGCRPEAVPCPTRL